MTNNAEHAAAAITTREAERLKEHISIQRTMATDVVRALTPSRDGIVRSSRHDSFARPSRG